MANLKKKQIEKHLPSALDFPESELVIGLVGPSGTDLNFVERELRKTLRSFAYAVETVRLSHYLREMDFLETTLKTKPEAERIASHMDAGNEARRKSEQREFLALRAIADLHLRRKESDDEVEARPRTAYIVLSLKTPEEVQALRRVYGPSFVLIGVAAPEDERIRALIRRGMKRAAAQKIIRRDEAELDPFGQRTQETFHLSDAFVPLYRRKEAARHLSRFVELLFGHPFHTPTREEYAMFLAYSAAVRSADLSRQVGAVVISEAGDVISTGCNDVPKAGGGLYWPGSTSDRRDFQRGFDSNARLRDMMSRDFLDRVIKAVAPKISKRERKRAAEELFEREKEIFRKSAVSDITEFGRAVHAEMEALLSCARSGVSPRGGTLFSTTFPCHNCAKHIVASGISRVFYVEPYAKSRAIELHSDSVTLKAEKGKVQFEPFAGVGPRKFVDLFSTSLGSGVPKQRKRGDAAIGWKPATARLRMPLLPTSYLKREMIAATVLMEGWTRASQQAKGSAQ